VRRAVDDMRVRVGALAAALLLPVVLGFTAASADLREWPGPLVVTRDTGAALSGVPRFGGLPSGALQINAIVADGRGGWFVGGLWRSIGSFSCPNVAHLLRNRHVDPRFCPRADEQVFALARVGERLYVGGSFTHIGGAPRSYLAAVDTRTGAATAWDPNLELREPRHNEQNAPLPGHVAAIAGNGASLYVWGEFDHVSGERRLGLARFDGRTGSLAPWHTTRDLRLASNVFSFIPPPIAVGSRAVYLLSEHFPAPVAVDTRTGALMMLRRLQGEAVLALGIRGKTLFLSGGYSSGTRLLTLATDTGRIRRWKLRFDGYIDAVAPAGPRLLVGGVFDRIGGVKRRSLAGDRHRTRARASLGAARTEACVRGGA